MSDTPKPSASRAEPPTNERAPWYPCTCGGEHNTPDCPFGYKLKPDPLQGLRDAKYLNPVCAADGCQWLRQQSVASRAALETLLRAEYEKRGIRLEPYLAGPRNDRYERVESHGFDDALSIVEALLARAERQD